MTPQLQTWMHMHALSSENYSAHQFNTIVTVCKRAHCLRQMMVRYSVIWRNLVTGTVKRSFHAYCYNKFQTVMSVTDWRMHPTSYCTLTTGSCLPPTLNWIRDGQTDGWCSSQLFYWSDNTLKWIINPANTSKLKNHHLVTTGLLLIGIITKLS